MFTQMLPFKGITESPSKAIRLCLTTCFDYKMHVAKLVFRGVINWQSHRMTFKLLDIRYFPLLQWDRAGCSSCCLTDCLLQTWRPTRAIAFLWLYLPVETEKRTRSTVYKHIKQNAARGCLFCACGVPGYEKGPRDKLHFRRHRDVNVRDEW